MGIFAHRPHGKRIRRRCVTNVGPALVGALLVMSGGCSDSTPTSTSPSITGVSESQLGSGYARGPNIVIEFVGTAQGEMREVDGILMDCFDLDVIDPRTGRVIGEGSDCLDLNSIVGDPLGGEGFALSNTQFFHLRGGFVKSSLRTTIQPVVEASSAGNTHITGDAPGGEILEGTGRFRGLEGGVARLSGAVDLSQFDSNIITFNCIFVLSHD